MSTVQGCPTRTIIFYVQWTVIIGVKTLIWHLNYKDHIILNMCTKFQFDWTSTSLKTTSTKNFNLKQDRRMNQQMDEQTKGRTDQKT